MSIVAKTVLGSTVTLSVCIIVYVHKKQTSDKLFMREGVIKDYERQHMKKLLNVKTLTEQSDLEKRLRAQRSADLKDRQAAKEKTGVVEKTSS